MIIIYSFLCQFGFGLGLAGDLSNPEELLQKGRVAVAANNWNEARAYFIDSISAVLHERDLAIAIEAIKALDEVYRNIKDIVENPFPSDALNAKAPFVRWTWPGGDLIEEKVKGDTLYWSKHRYFQSMLTANQLCHAAKKSEQDRERLLLLAMHIKPGYLPTISATLRHYLDGGQMEKAKKLYSNYKWVLPVSEAYLALGKTTVEPVTPKRPFRGFGPEDENRDSQAAQLYRQGNEQALQSRLETGNAEDYYYRALIMYRKWGQIPPAGVMYLENAAKLEKNNIRYSLMAATWSDENKGKKASPYFANLYGHSKTHPKRIDLLYQAARMAGRGGSPKKAELYTCLMENKPLFLDGYRGLKWLKTDEVLMLLEKNLSTHPDNEQLRKLAWTFFKENGLRRKGYKLIEKLFTENPQNTALAEILFQYGSKDAYAKTYAQLLHNDYQRAMDELDLYELPKLAGKRNEVEKSVSRLFLDFYLKSLIAPMELEGKDLLRLKKRVKGSHLSDDALQELLGDFYLMSGDMLRAQTHYKLRDQTPLILAKMHWADAMLYEEKGSEPTVGFDTSHKRPWAYLNNIWDLRRGGFALHRLEWSQRNHGDYKRNWRRNFFPKRCWDAMAYEREALGGDQLFTYLELLGFERSWLRALAEQIDLKSDNRFFAFFKFEGPTN